MRISFVRAFIVVMALLTGNAYSADANTYTNSDLGFSITKPANWFFDETPKVEPEVLVTITKYKKPYNGFNPTVAVSAHSLGNSKSATPLEISNWFLKEIVKIHPTQKTLQEPIVIKLGGYDAAYSFFTDNEHLAGEVLRKSWIIVKNDKFIMTNATTQKNKQNIDSRELDDIISTIKITK